MAQPLGKWGHDMTIPGMMGECRFRSVKHVASCRHKNVSLDPLIWECRLIKPAKLQGTCTAVACPSWTEGKDAAWQKSRVTGWLQDWDSHPCSNLVLTCWISEPWNMVKLCRFKKNGDSPTDSYLWRFLNLGVPQVTMVVSCSFNTIWWSWLQNLPAVGRFLEPTMATHFMI